MSQYENFVCSKCGNFYTTQVYESGNRVDIFCKKCKNANEIANGKIAGSIALVIFGLVVAAFWWIYSEFKGKDNNIKQIAIGLLVLCLSIFIVMQWGFIGACIVAIGLYFGWKYIKKNQSNEISETNTIKVKVEDDAS